MGKNKGQWLLLFFCLMTKGACQMYSQKCVIVDGKTGQPVVHASLYTRDNGRFRSVISKDDGSATVDFAFEKLTISHLNYEKVVVRRLKDTIRLAPKSYMTAEVLVQETEPAWIRRKLKEIIGHKDELYYNKDIMVGYDYSSQNIGKNTYYRYRSEGLLRLKNPRNNRYRIHQMSGTITANDSTSLTDVANLRRMLYEDFVTELDHSFVRSHRFAVNEEYMGGPGEVELAFRSQKDQEDHGRIVIDTLRNIVLSASRISGTESNKDRHVSAFMLSLSRLLSGYVILDWNVDYRVTYGQTHGTWHPQEIRYKFFFNSRERITDQREKEFLKETGNGFANMEAVLSIRPITVLPTEYDWKTLPKSWYIRYNSDEDRAMEIELSHLPADFTFFQ